MFRISWFVIWSPLFGNVEYNKMSKWLKSFLDFKHSPCSECCILSFGWFPGIWPTFRNTLSAPHSEAVWATYTAYEDGTECSETSAHKIQTREITQKKEYNIKNVVGYDGRLFLNTRTKYIKWMLVGPAMWPIIRRFQPLRYWTDLDGIC